MPYNTVIPFPDQYLTPERVTGKFSLGRVTAFGRLGPLFAAEQSQTRQGDVGEHWASLVYACLIAEITRPMSAKSIKR